MEQGRQQRPADHDETRLVLDDHAGAQALVHADGVWINDDRSGLDRHPSTDRAGLEKHPHLFAERSAHLVAGQPLGCAHARTVAAPRPMSPATATNALSSRDDARMLPVQRSSWR